MNAGAYGGDNQPVFFVSIPVTYLEASTGVTDVVSVDRWQLDAAATASWSEEDSHEC
tara:strand:+ start:38 stop:208 length:171 start_codon:yes stop_codon:yes gene_type:complete